MYLPTARSSAGRLGDPQLSRVEPVERRLDGLAPGALGLRRDLLALFPGLVDRRGEIGLGHGITRPASKSAGTMSRRRARVNKAGAYAGSGSAISSASSVRSALPPDWISATRLPCRRARSLHPPLLSLLVPPALPRSVSRR